MAFILHEKRLIWHLWPFENESGRKKHRFEWKFDQVDHQERPGYTFLFMYHSVSLFGLVYIERKKELL